MVPAVAPADHIVGWLVAAVEVVESATRMK